MLTLQVDASSTGLSAALIQGNQPVAYASKALIPTQQKYAQIEKELLDCSIWLCQIGRVHYENQLVCSVRSWINRCR